MRVLFYMVICASVFAENWGRFHGSLTPLALGEKFLRSLRVILYMGSPQIFNFWGERKQQSPNDASVIHCDLLAERESTAKTFLRFSIAASAQQMHLLLPIIVLCSAIFRRVFLALRSPRSLREPLLQLRCHHLALATQLALAQKSTFLKIPISFTPLIPCLLPPREEREKTERRASQNCNDFCPKIAIFPPLSAIPFYLQLCKLFLHLL